MLDNVVRLREPAAWIVVAVTAASIVLSVTRFGLELGSGVPVSAAAQDVALTAMNLTLVIVVVALVWACAPRLLGAPRTERLIAVAATVVTVGTLVTIVGAGVGASASAGTLAVVLEILGGLLDIVVKLVASATLWLLLRGLRAGTHRPRRRPSLRRVRSSRPRRAARSWRPRRTRPSGWSLDPTSGAAWASAADAAEGCAGGRRIRASRGGLASGRT
jgi:hypothetical protein